MSGNIGPAVAAQLTTALSNAGNIRIIDWDFFQQNGGNPSKLVNKKAGEVGPFIVRGVVTGFSEIAEASGESTGGSLGAIGAALRDRRRDRRQRARDLHRRGRGAREPDLPEHGRAPHRHRRDGPEGRRSDQRTPGQQRRMANGSFSSESAANGFSMFGFGRRATRMR